MLIIDDEKDFCLLLKTYFSRKNHEVYFANSLADGLQVLQNIHPDVVFLDNNLPDGLGWDKALYIAEKYPDLQLNLISANHTNRQLSPNFKIWEKPITFSELDKYIR